jgi:DNA polymerase-3 subunit delta
VLGHETTRAHRGRGFSWRELGRDRRDKNMIFFIYGTDHYRCQQKLNELKTGFKEKRDPSGLNLVSLNADNLDFDAFRQEAFSVPFLSEKKMIVIKNALANKKLEKTIAEFIKDSETKIDNILCFIDFLDPIKYRPSKNKSLELSGPLFKLLTKQKFHWEFNLLNNLELAGWLKDYLQKNQIHFEPAAINKLIISSGNDLQALVIEIAKLSAYKKNGSVTAGDVNNLVQAKFDENIFNLIDALGQKKRQLALKLISDRLNSGTHPLMLLSLISRQFKILIRAQNPKATAQNLGVHPFVLLKARQQGRNFSSDQLKNIFQALIKLDSQLKSSAVNPELLLNLFVAKNC